MTTTVEEHLWVGEVGRRMGLSARTVRLYCEAGRFAGAWRTPYGKWRIPASEVTRLMTAGRK